VQVRNPLLAQVDSLDQPMFQERESVYLDDSSSIDEQLQVQVQYDRQFRHLRK
jgi:hypothetical protein